MLVNEMISGKSIGGFRFYASLVLFILCIKSTSCQIYKGVTTRQLKDGVEFTIDFQQIGGVPTISISYEDHSVSELNRKENVNRPEPDTIPAVVFFQVRGSGKRVSFLVNGVNAANGRVSKFFHSEHKFGFPPLPPRDAIFGKPDYTFHKLQIVQRGGYDIVEKYVLHCHSAEDWNSQCDAISYKASNNIYGELKPDELFIYQLKQGARYQFELKTFSAGMESNTSFVTKVLTATEEPFSAIDITAREGNVRGQVIVSMFNGDQSIQDSFLVKCKSETDTEHICTQGDGLRLWMDRNPDATKAEITIDGLAVGESYIFVITAVSRYGVRSRTANSRPYLVPNTPEVTCDADTNSSDISGAQVGASKSEASGGIPSEAVFTFLGIGFIVGMVGTAVALRMKMKNSEDDKKVNIDGKKLMSQPEQKYQAIKKLSNHDEALGLHTEPLTSAEPAGKAVTSSSPISPAPLPLSKVTTEVSSTQKLSVTKSKEPTPSINSSGSRKGQHRRKQQLA